MNKKSRKFKKQKTIALLVMLPFSMLVFLDFFVDVGQYFPNKVHEFGHKLVMERKPGVQYCFYDHVPGAYQTTCMYEEGSLTKLDQLMFNLGGYTFELFVAFLVMLTPLSLVGGAWMLRIQYSILFHNNLPSNDLYGLSHKWKLLIALFLAFMFFMSLIIQNRWIDYGLKWKRKLKRQRK